MLMSFSFFGPSAIGYHVVVLASTRHMLHFKESIRKQQQLQTVNK